MKIENYKNASMLANECAYLKAQELTSDKEYEQASALFSEISGYKDADVFTQIIAQFERKKAPR